MKTKGPKQGEPISAKVTNAWGRRTLVWIIITLFKNCKLKKKNYLMNHVSVKTLTTGQMISSETRGPPAIKKKGVFYRLQTILIWILCCLFPRLIIDRAPSTTPFLCFKKCMMKSTPDVFIKNYLFHLSVSCS